MTEGKIEAFLKLFCITESRHGSFETSWQSWMVLCLCIVSAVATASSGAYFHRNNAVKSSVICFTVTTVGCGMAMVTFIAILMGCKRRRRCTPPVRNNGDLTIYTNPGILEQGTRIQIEHEDPVVSQTENELWMNPAFTEYDKSLYEADWNLGKNVGKTFEREETDFDERDSDDFHSSSETVTCSHRSYSDDEGYFHNSSKENNVKGTGKYSLERRGNKLVPEQDLLERGEFVEKVSVPSKSSDTNRELSKTPENSKRDEFKSIQHKRSSNLSSNIKDDPLISKSAKHYDTENIADANLNLMKNTSEFCTKSEKHELNLDLIEHESVFYRPSAELQNSCLISVAHEKDIKLAVNSCTYKKHSSGVCLKKSLDFQNDSLTSNSIRRDNFPKCVDTKNFPNENVLLYKESNPSERSAKCHNDLNSCMPSSIPISTVVNVEDSSQPTTKHCECSLPTKTVIYQNTSAPMTQTTHPKVFESSHSFPHYQNLGKPQHSEKKSNLPAEFPSLPYPILPKESSNPHCKNQRRRSSKSGNSFTPRYEKRPLLDMNGMPLSQKDLVKALTGILTNGLQQKPKHQIEHQVEQAFQLDIESLQTVLC